MPNGLKVDRSYFRTDHSRWSYHAGGSLFFIERIEDKFILIQDGIVVDQADSRAAAERLLADFDKAVAAEREE